MKIENVEVFGFRNAIHGMRNPMNSWDKSDSLFMDDGAKLRIGDNDKELAKKLIKAGSEHRKFLRMIHIQCFITLPRYIWQEMDTYKISTVRMSCSTMHKLGMSDLTEDDFEGHVMSEVLSYLNILGGGYRIHKNVETLRLMKQILPEGFLQSADLDFNYETAMNMYNQRKNHRMSEWSGENGICKWIESLPMMKEWLFL